MKAIVCTGYGSPDVLQLQDVETPTPDEDEVLIEVYATTVTSADWRIRSLNMPTGFGLLARMMFGMRKPRQPILGSELAGVIESVGSEVTRFDEGDAVVAFTDARLGCHAEYVCLPEDAAIAPKPENLTFIEAAALCFGGATAMEFFRWGDLKPGEHVLVNGASGSVGTAAVQLAKYFGADVTGVCSTAHLDLVQRIGADAVLDYTEEDVTKHAELYDIILDTAGTIPLSRGASMLADGGRFLMVLGTLPQMLHGPWVSLTTGKRVISGPAQGHPEDVRLLAELAEAGHYTPVIDRSYPFERIAEAHSYVGEGHKTGNVAVTLRSDGDGAAEGSVQT